jgi:hypothetical protein
VQNAKLGVVGAIGPSVIAAVVIVCALLAAIVPTCLYRYVEPRGRLLWARALDAPSTRRAPLVVRATAWLSFALGQWAVLGWIVPVECASLVYLQYKLGVGLPLGVVVTAVVGAMAVAQSLLAFRLFPVGVKLLLRDPRWDRRMASLARSHGVASGLLLGAGSLLGSAMTAFPGLVHPWLRAALVGTALRSVTAVAAAGLVHALSLAHCGRALGDRSG